jgi:hypothetical protein
MRGDISSIDKYGDKNIFNQYGKKIINTQRGGNKGLYSSTLLPSGQSADTHDLVLLRSSESNSRRFDDAGQTT